MLQLFVDNEDFLMEYTSDKNGGQFDAVNSNIDGETSVLLNDETKQEILLLSCYVPSHFIHGLLAYHCSSETGYEAGRTKINNGDQVKLIEESSLYKFFAKSNIFLNDFLYNWRVLEVYDNAQSGYLGIIYINEVKKQLVLAHRSTNFKLSVLTSSILKQSGLQQDIDGILMGNILIHQGHGYELTLKAVNCVKNEYPYYALSFTGHSLGGWLADLSVFYCHDVLEYPNVLGVTFDGPGSYEMIQKMISGAIRGSRKKVKVTDLEIVAYLSAPNIVNCTNKHVGTVYRLFPDNKEEEILPEWVIDSDLLKTIINQLPGEVSSIFGHYLQLILQYFDPYTEKPFKEKCMLVKNWPTISNKSFEKANLWSIIDKIICWILEKEAITTGIQKVFGNLVNLYGIHNTTIESIAHLFAALCLGKIDLHQFWLVHKNDQSYIIDQFNLQYEAQYQVENVNYFTRQNQANLIDRFLNVLVKNNQKVQGKTLYAIANICQYRVLKKQFEIKVQYRKEFTMDHIVGCIQAWWCREPDFEIKLNSIVNFKQLKSNLDFIDLPNMELEVSKIVKLFESSKVVIVKGMTATGKTALAQSYAQNFKREFVTQLLLASSKEVLNESLIKCTKSLNLLLDGEDGPTSAFKNHLNDSKQNVLFILDDVKDFAHVVKFITTLVELSSVRIIVTTQHDQLLKNESSERSGVLSTLYDCISEMNLNYSLEKFSVNYKPIPIVQTIMGNIDSKDMNFLYTILPFIKPNTLSKSNLTEILEYFTNLESARNCIDKLESLSLITTNKNQNIAVCEQVQEIALENFKLPTVLDSIKLFSRFRLDNILENNIFLIVSYYDLDEYIATDVFNQLIINIGIAEMAHLVNIFSKLLQKHDIESKYDKSVKFLKEIFCNLKKNMEEKLQLLFSSLADDWKNILYEIDNLRNSLKSKDDHTVTMMTETIKNIEKRFLRNNQIQIEKFLVAFNAFYETSTKEFMNTMPEKCLRNIFVTGVTGSGKSTAINYMIGNHLECKTKGVVGKCTIEVSQQNGNDVAVIGNISTSSETTLIKPYYDKENSDGLIFWDCPGFLDSHGNIARIRNAFLINCFGKDVSEYKILLVVDSSEIFAARGGQFIELLRKIKSIYPNFNISKSLCLLITKGESYDEDIKKEYTDQFSELAEAHKDCEEILNYFSSGNGISFFPKVKKGEVTENSFKNINVIKTGDTLCHKIPAIIIDQETSIKLTTINNLLNQYAHFIIEENVSEKVREITNMIQKYTFKKSDIPINNCFAQLSHPIEAKQFFKKLKSISNFHETVTSVENVLKTLRFFNILNNSLEVNLEKWVTSFITLDKLYSALREEPIAQAHPDGGIEIKVPILSATEIQNLYKKFKSDIRAASFLFIFDNNIKLPSVNLSIASCEWRILNDKEISLNGDDSKNSGSFYGIAKNASGGKITFLLNGCDGSNGKFDLSGIENSLFTMGQEILNLESSLYMLQHIKSLKKHGLDKELDSLQKEETKEDEEETEESSNAKEKKLNFIKELKKLEDIVMQYENIPQQYLLVKKFEEGNTRLIGNDAESLSLEDFKVAVEKQREKINKVEKKLQKSINSKELLKKTKNISSDLGDTVYQYDKEYRKHRNVVKEYFYDRLLCLNEFQVKLNGQKWINIDKEEETVINLIKEIKEDKDSLEKNMNDLKTDVENFNNVSEKRRKCEREKEELKKIANKKQEEQLKSSDLFQKVENLTKTADEKAKITKLWNDEVERKDIIFPGSDEQFVPANREILNRTEDMDEFLKHCLNEKNSLEKEINSDVFRNITHESEELYKIKTKINIVEIKKNLNYFIDIFKLEIVKCDLSTGKDTEELQEELQNTKKKLWAMEHYFGTIRSKLPFEENQLDIWIKQKLKMKKSLVDRLENATKYYEKVLSIYNEFKIKEQLHKIAENEYSMYAMNECSGKNAQTAGFVEAYNKFIEINKEITMLINEEAKIVTKMLKYKFNLFERIERKFKDREFWSKIAYVTKELLVFNKQYYEKYKLSGSNGNKGSNSGGFHFDGSKNHVERVEQKIGKGGKNADALEGIYISEYSFSTIRRISEKRLNKEKRQDHTIGGTPYLFPPAFMFKVAKGIGFRGISLGSLTCGSFITQLTISPIVAQLSSTLINGPYKTDRGNAKDGQNEQVKESQMIWKKEFLNYIGNPEMQDVSLLFPHNNKT